MKLKPNRVLLEKSLVVQHMMNKGEKSSSGEEKLDISFLDKSNFISNPRDYFSEQLRGLDKFALMDKIIMELDKGSIVLTKTKNPSNNKLLFTYGMSSDKKSIKVVYINLSAFMKRTKGIDKNTGDLVDSYQFTLNSDEFYNLILAGYVGLKAERCFDNGNLIVSMRKFCTDTFAQIISRNFGNPIDGEKLRFISDCFFYNKDIDADSLAAITKFNTARINLLKTKFPGFFSRGGIDDGSDLKELIDIINEEFKVFKTPVTLENLIIGAAEGLGDGGAYMLDNHPYLLSLMILKARKSKVNKGYMLKRLEQSSAVFLNQVLTTLSH